MRTITIPNSLLEIFNLEQIILDVGSNPFYMEQFGFLGTIYQVPYVHTNNGFIESLIENQIA